MSDNPFPPLDPKVSHIGIGDDTEWNVLTIPVKTGPSYWHFPSPNNITRCLVNDAGHCCCTEALGLIMQATLFWWLEAA